MHHCLDWMGSWPSTLFCPPWPSLWLVEWASACPTVCTDTPVPPSTKPHTTNLWPFLSHPGSPGEVVNEAFTTGSWNLITWHCAYASFIYAEPPAQRPQLYLSPWLRLHQGRFILSLQVAGVKDDFWTCNELGQLITQFCCFLKEM